MEVEAALALIFFDLDLDAVLVGPGVLTDAGDLPGNLDSWDSAGYLELVIRNLFGYVRFGAGAPIAVSE